MIRVGLDSKARLIEVGAVLDDNQWLIIHAMKARKKYLEQASSFIRRHLLWG